MIHSQIPDQCLYELYFCNQDKSSHNTTDFPEAPPLGKEDLKTFLYSEHLFSCPSALSSGGKVKAVCQHSAELQAVMQESFQKKYPKTAAVWKYFQWGAWNSDVTQTFDWTLRWTLKTTAEALIENSIANHEAFEESSASLKKGFNRDYNEQKIQSIITQIKNQSKYFNDKLSVHEISDDVWQAEEQIASYILLKNTERFLAINQQEPSPLKEEEITKRVQEEPWIYQKTLLSLTESQDKLKQWKEKIKNINIDRACKAVDPEYETKADLAAEDRLFVRKLNIRFPKDPINLSNCDCTPLSAEEESLLFLQDNIKAIKRELQTHDTEELALEQLTPIIQDCQKRCCIYRDNL